MAGRTYNIKAIEALLDSALEHGSHGWLDIERRLNVQTKIKDVWPPSVSNKVGSAEYHIAAMIGYIKQAYDLIAAEKEHTDEVMEKVENFLRNK